jgi:hypothetical protein
MKINELTVVAKGASGIEIRALLDVAHNCVEFTLRSDVPQAVFISPWMQFEPAAMNDQRLHIAHEIVRRALAHDNLLDQVTMLQKQLKSYQDSSDDKARTQETTYRMWREDRARAGFPEDFSDIKEWPPEMMGGYNSKEK